MSMVHAEKSAVRQAKCEACSCIYVYKVTRGASQAVSGATMTGARVGGIAGALIGAAIDAASGDGKIDRAQQKADLSAKKRLELTVAIVPCPDCGWYQLEMVKEARKRARVSNGMKALVTCGALGLIALFIMRTVNSNSNPRGPAPIPAIAFWIGGAIAILFVAAYAIRWGNLGTYDINQGYPAARPPVKGALEGKKVRPAMT